MQMFTNGLGSRVLMLTEQELTGPECQAAVVASLNEGASVTVQNLMSMKKKEDGQIFLVAGDKEQSVGKNAVEVVAAILAYKTPERIFAYLGA